MTRAFLIYLAIASAACLAACGQKGPLTLPETAAAITVPATQNGNGPDEQTSDETEDNED